MIRLGILGWPVEHSRSPAIHAEVHRVLGIDASYELLPVPPGDLVAAVRGLAALGFRGANVTVPHKQAVVEACDELTAEAELIGAVNTLHWHEGRLVGDNTDARGYVASLDEDAPDWDAGGRSALVFGTGGAARAVVVGLARRGVPLAVAGRRPQAAEELAELGLVAGAPSSHAVPAADVQALGAAAQEAGLVVNATPLGMGGEPLPAPLMALDTGQIASDLVYTPPETPFVARARERGAAVVVGTGMLIHQAALASARWHAVAPPVRACRDGMLR